MIPEQRNTPFTYALAERINHAWYTNSLVGCVLYGAWNVGKSSYCVKVLMDLWNDPKGKRLDEWKYYVVFKPEHYTALNLYLMSKGERAQFEVWDDAGLWLYALEWSDSKVKGAVKFLNVAKTTSAGLVLTTPTPKMIVKKVTDIEGINIGKVTHTTGAPGTANLRVAKIYTNTMDILGNRRIRTFVEDPFSVMLPDHVWEWYNPLRKSYAMEALTILAKAHGVDVDFAQHHTISEAFEYILHMGARAEVEKTI